MRRVVVRVNLDGLFDDETLQKLLDGARAEDIEPIPPDVARLLEAEADRMVMELVDKQGLRATERFRRALREWFKLLLWRFWSAV